MPTISPFGIEGNISVKQILFLPLLLISFGGLNFYFIPNIDTKFVLLFFSPFDINEKELNFYYFSPPVNVLVIISISWDFLFK
jgi:hypothetical protein